MSESEFDAALLSALRRKAAADGVWRLTADGWHWVMARLMFSGRDVDWSAAVWHAELLAGRGGKLLGLPCEVVDE